MSNEQKRQTKSLKAELEFPVGRIGNKVRGSLGLDNKGKKIRTQEAAIISMTSITETIVLEIMKNAKEEMCGKTLKPIDLRKAVNNRNDLKRIFDGHFPKSGDNQCDYIQRIVLDKKTRTKK